MKTCCWNWQKIILSPKKNSRLREYEKLRSTYVDAFAATDQQTRWTRAHRLPAGCCCYRPIELKQPESSKHPNPNRKGRQIRKAFVSRDKDYLFMSADYSQIELRIAASFAKDEIMIDAFKNKRDIHTTTAAKVFKVSLDKVTPDMRRKAKKWTSAFCTAVRHSGFHRIWAFHEQRLLKLLIPISRNSMRLSRYMDNSIIQARDTEFVETIF